MPRPPVIKKQNRARKSTNSHPLSSSVLENLQRRLRSKSGKGICGPKNQVVGDPVRKRRKYRPGTLPLREIRRLQNSTDLLISRLAFSRFAREIMRNLGYNLMFQTKAMLALHEAAEAYLVGKCCLFLGVLFHLY